MGMGENSQRIMGIKAKVISQGRTLRNIEI